MKYQALAASLGLTLFDIGNRQYKQKDYHSASSTYGYAIKLLTNTTNPYRAHLRAAYYRMSKSCHAINEFQKAEESCQLYIWHMEASGRARFMDELEDKRDLPDLEEAKKYLDELSHLSGEG